MRPLIHKSTEPEAPPPPLKKQTSEATKTVMLAVAFLCLLIAGVLIAWHAGLFGVDKPPPAPERASNAPEIKPVPALEHSEDVPMPAKPAKP